jgi:heme/copper-type cytochrome/quinol oxidase subunit 3
MTRMATYRDSTTAERRQHAEASSSMARPARADANAAGTARASTAVVPKRSWRRILIAEIVVFGLLFITYVTARVMYPAAFAWGGSQLSTGLGMLGLFTLIASSGFVAWAVHAAQRGDRVTMIGMLMAALGGGATFLAIQAAEYTDAFSKPALYGMTIEDPPARTVATVAHEVASQGIAEASTAPVADPLIGRQLWMDTCVACHGNAGEGVIGQAFDIRDSEFTADQSDDELLAFIKQGRPSFDAANTTGIQMPPKGGNPLLKDADLRHIIAHMRTFEPLASDGAVAGSAGANDATDPAANGGAATGDAFAQITDIRLPKSSIPVAGPGPTGLHPQWETRGWRSARYDGIPSVDPRHDPARPAHASTFFTIFYTLSGVHALALIVAMALCGGLIVVAGRTSDDAALKPQVWLAGTFWHSLTVIWILLVPLFYVLV